MTTTVNPYWVQAYLDGHLTAAAQSNPTAYAREFDAATLAACRSAANALRESAALRRKFWERPTETARKLAASMAVAPDPKPYQPKTGEPCHCKPGRERDNCPDCEGTGMRIDFAAIRARTS